MTAWKNEEHLVLAFDAGCGACATISAAVAEASEHRLQVLPLNHPEVEQWRKLLMGPDPTWAPTLLLLRDGAPVKAWTGPGMSLALARRLGPRSTTRVLRALGDLRQETRAARPESDTVAEDTLGRKRFLQLCGGVVTAIGITVAGQTPALARSEMAGAHAWVAANTGRLPQTYPEIAKFSAPYRQAIVASLPPERRSQIWAAHFRHYRAGHPELAQHQLQVLDRASELLSRVFGTGQDHSAELNRLAAAAKRAFGEQEAGNLLERLGTADPRRGPVAYCDCATDSDWCWGSTCRRGSCTLIPDGCGTGGWFDCNGRCR